VSLVHLDILLNNEAEPVNIELLGEPYVRYRYGHHFETELHASLQALAQGTPRHHCSFSDASIPLPVNDRPERAVIGMRVRP
jgi:hypothetical protein